MILLRGRKKLFFFLAINKTGAMQTFALDSCLEADTLFLADWALSRVLLMNDARFPWLILVPRRAGVSELHELAHAERMVLIEEVARAARALKSAAAATKINVASLGNVVPQLHVHIVARTPADAAWPNPVWGYGACVPYASGAADALRQRLLEAF
jgi:diadenosine tetraphosphate (Ap4A) HIT family hydrolase